MGSDGFRVGLKAFFLHDVQRRKRRRRADRVTAERVEITERLTEGAHHIWPRGDRRNRMPVRHRLADGHHIRHDAQRLVPPEMRAEPPEAGLHLVGDEQAPGAPDDRCRWREEVRPQFRETFIGEERAYHHPGKADARVFQLGNRAGDIAREDLRLRLARSAQGRQRLRCGHQPDVGGIATDRRTARRKLRRRRRVAVIGVVGRDDPAIAGHRLRHTQRDIVRLGPGADHDCLAQIVAQGAGQPLDIVQHKRVVIPRMGVQRRRLTRDRFDHLGMAVPDMRDVVVGVEVLLPLGIPKPHAFAPDDMHRLVVEGRHIRAHQPCAALGQRLIPHRRPSPSAP